MPYVDGFVLAVPKDNVEAYKDLARRAGEVWMEYGALTYVECAGDDVPEGETTSFPMAVKARADEVVFFSWITYVSKESRDEIVAKVMADPRLQADESAMPFDGKRMIFGGFVPAVTF
ncbi:MAG: RNA signal recognition particle [Phenylobacterium sp. RIFCSPHIGHO2_01_FULL_70_10]|nr:MAG: RNA signal recognition particle [Phenylobacterium sp. RIFCSPHIGHO2_01_FULL_70_10]